MSNYIIEEEMNSLVCEDAEINLNYLNFNKRQGTAGINGQLYEIHLVMYFMIQARLNKKILNFRLATNMEEAGDFDDVVYAYQFLDDNGDERSKVIFVQAKHREHSEKKLSIDVLLSDTEKGDFLLKKYFSSYLEIKKELNIKNHPILCHKFQDCEFLILTNACFTVGALEKQNLRLHLVGEDDVLNFKPNNQYIQLVLGGTKQEKIVETLKYSSECKKLARELAQMVVSCKVIDINKPLIAKYHQALFENIFEQKGIGKGLLRTKFLNNVDLELSVEKFRSIFIEEIRKTKLFHGKMTEDILLELGSIEIILHEDFGHFNNCDTELPTELVSKELICEFLSKLKIFVGQPNVEELSTIIKQKMGEIYHISNTDTDIIFSDVEYKVRQWWKQGNECLTEKDRFIEESARVFFKFDVNEPDVHFTGRVSELQKIHEILENKSRMCVTGVSGIGKSELVKKYVSLHSQDYQNNIIWINAENNTTLSETFVRLAQDKLNIGSTENISRTIDGVYQFFENRKALFIFDNCSNLESLIKITLPKESTNIYLLIIAQSEEWKDTESLELCALQDEEAKEFVNKLSKDLTNDCDINELVQTLECLPLALKLATAYIKKENEKAKSWNKKEFTIRNYLELYHNILSESDDNMDVISRTCLLTVHKINQNSFVEEAIQVLSILSYLTADRIPVEIFSIKIPSREQLLLAVELLDKLSVICLKHKQIYIHRLVQKVVRVEFDKYGKTEEVIDKIYSLLQCAYKKGGLQLSHIHHFLDCVGEWRVQTLDEEMKKIELSKRLNVLLE